MVKRVHEGDRGLNIQDPMGNEELEFFVPAQSAKFVGLLMAYHYRRGNSRMGAVNHGTAHTIGTPVITNEAFEISNYYHHILELAQQDKESEDLYERAALLQINIETWGKELKARDLDEEERQELLIKIDKALVELEVMTGQMEKLANA